MTPQQLKNSILQYAMEGKLVPQIEGEGTAEDLYKQIQKEKQQLIKEGKIKKEKPLPPISDNEVPFEIPQSWKWVRLGGLSNLIQYGYNASAESKGTIRMVRISDIDNNRVIWDSVPFCNISDNDYLNYELKRNDILFARTGGTVGKSFLVSDIPYASVFAGYLIRTQYSNNLCPLYMKFFMESQLYWSQLHNGIIATAQPNCNGKTLAKMIIPLPPLAEQKRIVAKIEELLPLIDKYGEAYNQLNELEKKFPSDLKKSIRQYAMEGKLVPQIESEGTAEDLYKQIQKEKQQLTKEGKIKKEKPLPPISDDEVPFEIPQSWKYCWLTDITYNVGCKNLQIQSNQILKEGKFAVISQSQNLIDGFFNDERKIINTIPLVLFGDHTRNVKYIDFPFIVGADGTKLIKPILFDTRFLFFWLSYSAQIIKNRGYARHFNEIKKYPFMLPPLSEQKRIVAKIEELFAIIDKKNF